MEKAKQNTVLSAAVIGLKLLLICAIIAGLISFVYSLTKDTYDKNVEESKSRAIAAIFGDENGEKGITATDKNGDGVYAVYEKDVLSGYCVSLSTAGFNGTIELMVGYNADQSICGVEIINHSETPGLGSKYKEEADVYLTCYEGKSGAVEMKDIDVVTSATKTGNYVREGVNKATELLAKSLENGGAVE